MKTDLLLLTLLYVVAFAAFVGAVNARGPARVAISYFLAILCLCAAVFHTSQFLAAPVPEPVVITPPKPEPEVIAPAPGPDTAGLAASKREAAVGEAKAELKTVLESALRVQRNLASLKLGAAAEISDEEYESLQNRAISYLSEARRVKERMAALSEKLPPGLTEANEALTRGVESLVNTAVNAERFFKAENDSEEKERMAGFRRGSQATAASLRKAGDLLGTAVAGG